MRGLKRRRMTKLNLDLWFLLSGMPLHDLDPKCSDSLAANPREDPLISRALSVPSNSVLSLYYWTASYSCLTEPITTKDTVNHVDKSWPEKTKTNVRYGREYTVHATRVYVHPNSGKPTNSLTERKER
jgi:hypothetical protein